VTRGRAHCFLDRERYREMFCACPSDGGARSGTADNGSPFRLNAPRARKELLGRRSQGIHARKQRDFLMNSLTSILLAATVFGVATCWDSLGRASAASTPNSLTMTCAQLQDYIKKHGQTLLSSGRESGNYSFDYAECGGTVPGYACTTDQTYCYVGWWCDYNYPAQVNSQVHDQGTEFCQARR
jgi:hypothetical protein